MSVLERYVGALQALRSQVSEESLTNIAEGEKNAFGFGRAAGRLEGLRLAEQTLEKVLSEQEAEKRSAGRSRNSA